MPSWLINLCLSVLTTPECVWYVITSHYKPPSNFNFSHFLGLMLSQAITSYLSRWKLEYCDGSTYESAVAKATFWHTNPINSQGSEENGSMLLPDVIICDIDDLELPRNLLFGKIRWVVWFNRPYSPPRIGTANTARWIRWFALLHSIKRVVYILACRQIIMYVSCRWIVLINFDLNFFIFFVLLLYISYLSHSLLCYYILD